MRPSDATRPSVSRPCGVGCEVVAGVSGFGSACVAVFASLIAWHSSVEGLTRER